MDRNAINSRLKTTSIKGKEYVEVNQRILAFWEAVPQGRIVTELVSDNGERCLFKASIYDGEVLVATGHAFEVKSGIINTTSYVENCETSAIGRALGIYGIGATEAIASADEVSNAISQQTDKKSTAAKKTENKGSQKLTELQQEASKLKTEAYNLGMEAKVLENWLVTVFGGAKNIRAEKEWKLVCDHLTEYINQSKEALNVD